MGLSTTCPGTQNAEKFLWPGLALLSTLRTPGRYKVGFMSGAVMAHFFLLNQQCN